jgi:hypothetical protein
MRGPNDAMGEVVPRVAVCVLLMVCGWQGRAVAQCTPPPGSSEARLLAFYDVPLAFSPAGAPERLPAWGVVAAVEAAPIRAPSPALERTGYCFVSKTEHTRLAPAFGRPRVTLGLPAGVALEASYLPPVPIGSAEPNLASVAISRTQRVAAISGAGRMELLLRAQGTFGHVTGAITCPASGLQSSDPQRPCYGTRPSRDTFRPGMTGVEGALGFASGGGRVAVYGGGGVTWLRPHFQVGFTDVTGAVDRTEVAVDLRRTVAFGGVTVRAARTVDLSAQIYSVSADATTFRVVAGYRIGNRE